MAQSKSERMKQYLKERVAKRKLAGLCTCCPNKVDDDHFVRCSTCRLKGSRRHRQSKGLCTFSNTCQHVPDPGFRYCSEHLVMSRTQRAKIKANMRASGLCTVCNKTNDRIDFNRCSKCSSRESSRKLCQLKTNKDIVYAAYGGYQCKCCGESIKAFLSLDHIHNDGAIHRKEIGEQTSRIYKWIIVHNFPPIFQVMCLNCNIGKAKNGGVCPHVTARQTEQFECPSTG